MKKHPIKGKCLKYLFKIPLKMKNAIFRKIKKFTGGSYRYTTRHEVSMKLCWVCVVIFTYQLKSKKSLKWGIESKTSSDWKWKLKWKRKSCNRSNLEDPWIFLSLIIVYETTICWTEYYNKIYINSYIVHTQTRIHIKPRGRSYKF